MVEVVVVVSGTVVVVVVVVLLVVVVVVEVSLQVELGAVQLLCVSLNGV